MEKFHSCLLNYCKNINGSAWKNLIPAIQTISFVHMMISNIYLSWDSPTRTRYVLHNIWCIISCQCVYVLITCGLTFNKSYLTHSYIVFTLRMESVSKNTIFGLEMMVKNGLEKFILKSLPAGRWLFLLLNLWFWTLLWSKEK